MSLHAELSAILSAGGIEDAPLEAQWILEDIEDAEKAREIAKRRANHEPLQYLLGAWEFYGMKFIVGKGVLIPRADTETLVDSLLSRVSAKDSVRIADLCTGSGCIALSLQKHLPRAEICGLDISEDALGYARKNAQMHGLPVKMLKADICSTQTAAAYRELDILVSNPPYLTAEDMQNLQAEVRFEPQTALAGGTDGLDFYRRIAEIWRHSLKFGGMLAVEVGIDQAESVAEIFRQCGFSNLEIIPDLCGIPRVVIGKYTQTRTS